MKLTKLLVLSALWLVGLSVQAADLIERKAPSPVIDADALAAIEKVAAKFEVGKYYVLYNKGAQQYFSQGNNWGTRASVSDLPILVKFTLPEGKTLEDQTLYLENYCIYNKAWKKAFFDSQTSMFVDLNQQKNFYWQVVDQGNNVYRLQASPSNPDFTPTSNPGFVGRDPEVAEDHTHNTATERNINLENTYPLSPFMESGWIDWEFYEVKAWSTYEPAKALKEAVEKAEFAGLDISAAVTVYNNENSTVEQLNAATDALNNAMVDNIANATGQNPQYASSWITNGTFDTIDDFTGWSTDNGKFGSGGTVSTNAEVFGKSGFDINQDITVKYPGLYLFGVKSFYRAGGADDSYKRWSEDSDDARLSKFYVTVNGQTTETKILNIFDGAPTTKPAHGKAMESNGYWIPNSMADADQYFHTDNLYNNIVPVEVAGTDVAVRIGVKKSATDYDAWSIFDDFSIIFCGAGEDRYLGYAKTVAKNYPLSDDTIATKSYVDAYNELKNNPTGTDAASAEAYIANLKAAQAAIVKSAALWPQWEAKLAEAQVIIVDETYLKFDEIDPLLDYADPDGDESEYKAIQEAHNLDNAALQAEIEKLQGLIDDVKNAYKNQIEPGADVTDKFLTNPKFELKKEGWTGWENVKCADGRSMPVLGGTADNQTAEAWATTGGNFDLYQEVTNAPVGVYEISVQGFYRYGRGNEAYQAYKEQEVEYVKDGGAPVFVYMNDVKTPFKNVYEEPGQDQEFYVSIADKDENKEPKTNSDGQYIFGGNTTQFIESENLHYPNGMTGAAIAFSAGMYTQSASSLLAQKGDTLRIGVKGNTSQLNDSWVIWDNFTLTYRGFDVKYVKPVLEEAIAAAHNNLDKGFGSDLRAEILEKLEAAEALLNSEDGKAMFDAASALVGVDVDASIALFAELKSEISAMQNLAAAQTGVTDDATVDAAYILGDEISDLIEAGTLSDAQANEYLKKIEEMNAKLKIPAGMAEASDANPVPVTSLITNPKYAENKKDGWSGDEAAVSFHEAEMFNKNFDYYQDLENLMPGTYKVTVQGFYRAGDKVGAIDYNNWLKDPEAYNYALLYAKSGDNTFSAPLKRLCTEAVEMAAGEAIPGGWAATKTDTITWEPDTVVQHFIVPDNMEQAEQAFLKTDPAYNYTGNEVIFTVGEDGKARIGVKKEQKLDWDWTLWTNWQLTYYGANSELEPSLGVIAATGTRVVKTEYFSLSGSRLKSARGLVIVKQTMNDGSVRVIKKVK